MSQDRPSREVAWRVFAAEFDDADFSYAESDEERAPNYVVTPTGARVNRLFAVGVLTEVEQVSDDVLRARVVDPTGAFVVYAGQYQPDALASLERLDTPTFVAVTGKARTFEPDDADTVYTSVRPESISEVDAETRDRWVVRTAEQTIDRIAATADALRQDVRGDDLRDALVSAGVRPDLAAGIPVAIDHYGTTETYLDALRTVAVQAAEVVAGDREEVDVYTPAPDEGGPVDTGLAADLDVDVPETTESPALSESATAESADVESAAETSEAEPGTDAGEESAPADSGTDETEEAAVEETADHAETVASESGSAVEDEPEAADAGDVGTTEELAESTAPEPETVEPEVEDSEEDLGDFDAGSEDSEEAVDEQATTAETEESGVETDEMYEFDEEERAEIEEEFDMDFSSGEDIPEAGEAGIDAEPEEPEAAEGVEDETSTAEDTGADADAPSFEGDLEDVVVDVMDDLDDGDGVARDEVVRTVVEEYDAETGDVEDAIQSALMSGRCYESGEDTLKAI